MEIADTKSTYPSMRNCPGAGRPTWMESFNRSSRAAQLSTKLVTGILRDRAAMATKTVSSPSGYFPLSTSILLSDTVKSIFRLFRSSFNTRWLHQVIKKRRKAEQQCTQKTCFSIGGWSGTNELQHN